jgi:hypothetical protein
VAHALLGVTYSSGSAPLIAILSPTPEGAYESSSGTINLAGGASGSPALDRVTWANDRGGSGTATGTLSWSVRGIALQSGSNRITVTAWDSTGNSSTASIAVTYNGSGPQSPRETELRRNVSGRDLVFTWTDPRYVLQTKSALSDSNWRSVPGGSPASIPMVSNQGFYRLYRQP